MDDFKFSVSNGVTGTLTLTLKLLENTSTEKWLIMMSEDISNIYIVKKTIKFPRMYVLLGMFY